MKNRIVTARHTGASTRNINDALITLFTNGYVKFVDHSELEGWGNKSTKHQFQRLCNRLEREYPKIWDNSIFIDNKPEIHLRPFFYKNEFDLLEATIIVESEVGKIIDLLHKNGSVKIPDHKNITIKAVERLNNEFDYDSNYYDIDYYAGIMTLNPTMYINICNRITQEKEYIASKYPVNKKEIPDYQKINKQIISALKSQTEDIFDSTGVDQFPEIIILLFQKFGVDMALLNTQLTIESINIKKMHTKY